MNLDDAKKNGRQGRFKDKCAENSRDSNMVPRNSSRLEISILNIAHGEEASNYDHRSIMEDEQPGNFDPENMNETEDINVKFKKTKSHGLMSPLHPQQVGTWVVMTILVLSFYLFLVPGTYYIGTGFAVFIGLVYGSLLIGVVIFCLRATLTDPTDRNVLYERQCRKEGVEAEENDELEFFCDVCEAYVHERTKHCGECNRCSDLFDHHCKWLNNCIGGKNYADFLILISVLCAQTLIFMIISLIFVITALSSKSKFQEGFYKYYDTDLNRFGLAVFIVILNILCGLIVFFTISLVFLHIKLKKIGLTAYEYIVYKEEAQERLELFEAGEMSRGEYEEEERKAQDDLRKKKKERIIERNKKAKAQQEKEQAATKNALTKSQTPSKDENTKNKTKKHKSEQKKEDFVDIMKDDENPQRVQNYSAGPKMNASGRKAKYADVEDIKIEMAETDTKKKLNFNPGKETSEESKESKEPNKEEANKNMQGMMEDFNDREDDSGERQESDINDRADWKMPDEVKGNQKVSSNTHINNSFKQEDVDSTRKINNDFETIEKRHVSEIRKNSDSI
ncbi:unnamed protein product [Moneuplotes crassus]|uniref:Palmitoyltransferase n=1 Tax=Euplotes crassus TaxID=5936 RepID=A0AAD1U5H5_EUPCR|nr:unnamed protein product [Moneuplotes crassus]